VRILVLGDTRKMNLAQFQEDFSSVNISQIPQINQNEMVENFSYDLYSVQGN
jgi:hypothetical protein